MNLVLALKASIKCLTLKKKCIKNVVFKIFVEFGKYKFFMPFIFCNGGKNVREFHCNAQLCAVIAGFQNFQGQQFSDVNQCNGRALT